MVKVLSWLSAEVLVMGCGALFSQITFNYHMIDGLIYPPQIDKGICYNMNQDQLKKMVGEAARDEVLKLASGQVLGIGTG